MDGTVPFERQAESMRRRAYRQIEPQAQSHGLSLANKALVGLIIAATALAITETEPSLIRTYGRTFTLAEYALGSIFALEYAVRLWIAPERDPARSA